MSTVFIYFNRRTSDSKILKIFRIPYIIFNIEPFLRYRKTWKLYKKCLRTDKNDKNYNKYYWNYMEENRRAANLSDWVSELQSARQLILQAYAIQWRIQVLLQKNNLEGVVLEGVIFQPQIYRYSLCSVRWRICNKKRNNTYSLFSSCLNFFPVFTLFLILFAFKPYTFNLITNLNIKFILVLRCGFLLLFFFCSFGTTDMEKWTAVTSKLKKKDKNAPND